MSSLSEIKYDEAQNDNLCLTIQTTNDQNAKNLASLKKAKNTCKELTIVLQERFPQYPLVG